MKNRFQHFEDIIRQIREDAYEVELEMFEEAFSFIKCFLLDHVGEDGGNERKSVFVCSAKIIDAPNTIRTTQPAVILRNTNLQLGISKRIVCIPYIMVCKEESMFSNDAIVLSLPFYDSCHKVDMVSLLLTQKDIEKYGFNSSDDMVVVCDEKSQIK